MKKLLIACALLAFTATACPVDPPVTTDWSKCPTAGAGQVQVAVVTEGLPTTSPKVVCVVVPEGSSGLDALNARAVRIGKPGPRTESTVFGPLVCAVDGTPLAPDCGVTGPEGTSFWSYWNGGGSWTESMIGAHDRVVEQGSVDGWKFGTWDFSTTFPTAPAASPNFNTLTGAPAPV